MSEVFVLDATKRALNLVHPRAKNGSNRANNLVVACSSCNQRKGSQDIGIFLTDDAERLARILSQVKLPLRDAAVNATRFAYGYFNITTQHRTVEGINHCFCTLIARADGYNYLHRKERVLPPIA